MPRPPPAPALLRKWRVYHPWHVVPNMEYVQASVSLEDIHFTCTTEWQTDRQSRDGRTFMVFQDQTWMDGVVVYCVCRRPFNAVDET